VTSALLGPALGRLRQFLLVGALVAVTLAAGAEASRPARPAETRAIARAALTFMKTQSTSYYASHIQVVRVGISTIDPHWADAHVVAKPGTPPGRIQRALVILNRIGTHWRGVYAGGDCISDAVPKRILIEFFGPCAR
jgi:hypothetical protein